MKGNSRLLVKRQRQRLPPINQPYSQLNKRVVHSQYTARLDLDQSSKNNGEDIKDIFKKNQQLIQGILKNTLDVNTMDARDYKWVMPFSQQLIKELEQSQSSNILASKWLGKMYFRVVSAAFELLTESELTYDQAKVYLCQNILVNIVNILEKKLLNKNSPGTFGTFINKKSIDIIQFLLTKYPQTKMGNPNKALDALVKPINNLSSYETDMLINSDISFKYKENGNYTQQIMKMINYIINLPSKPIQQFKKTNAQYFYSFFQSLFQTIYEPAHLDKSKMSQLQYQKAREQHREKQKKISMYMIGRKLGQNTPVYTQQEIQAQNFKIKAPGIMRIMTKWLEMLSQILQNPDKLITERNTRFKGKDGSAKKLYVPFKKIFTNIVKTKYPQWKRQIDTLINHCNIMQEQIGQHLYRIEKLEFLELNDQKFGDFACKLQNIVSQYLMHSLNKTIFYLNKVVEQSKKTLTKKMTQGGQDIQEERNVQKITTMLDIDLVEFKLGDLLRCKCISSQKNIIKIYQKLVQQCEKQSTRLEIVRIKNRLSTGTRDILINLLLNKQILCEVQLGIITELNQKQNFYDKFNHILYEIKRARFGPIIEIASIWCNYDQRSISFRNEIAKYQKRVQRDLQVYHNHKCQKQNLKDYYLPFICSCCKVLISRNNFLFPSLRCSQCNLHFCGICLDKGFTVKQKLEFIYGQNIKDFVPFISQFTKQNIKDMDIPQNGIIIKKNQVVMNIIYYHLLMQSENQESFMEQFNDLDLDKSQLQLGNSTYVFMESKYNKDFNLLKPVDHTVNIILQFRDKVSTKMGEFLEDNLLFYFHAQGHPFSEIYLQKIHQDQNLQSLSKILLKQGEKRSKEKNEIIKKNRSKLYSFHFKNFDKTLLFPTYATEDLQEKQHSLQAKKLIKKMIQQESVGISFSNGYFFKEVSQRKNEKSFLKVKELFYNHDSLFQNKQISIDVISVFKNLRVIELYNVPKVKASYFKELKYLQDINIYDGNITDQDLQELQPLEFLKNLTIDSSKITQLNSISKFKGLVSLQIENSFITEIIQLDLLNLKHLVLDYNQIQKIENLHKCPNLQYLSLSSNSIKTMENLEALVNMQYLSLSNNQLLKIQNLKNNKMLETLQLSNNSIKNISDEILTLHNLKILNLQGNELHANEIFQEIQKVLTILNQLKQQEVKVYVDQLLFSKDGFTKQQKQRVKEFVVKISPQNYREESDDGRAIQSDNGDMIDIKNTSFMQQMEMPKSIEQNEKKSQANLLLQLQMQSGQSEKNP